MTTTTENDSTSSKKNLTKMDVGEKESNGKYPKVVFLIILTELCERFSFYGLRTVLFIYFTEFLLLGSNTATSMYHAYSMLCYFSPIIGAIIADGYIGLYKTILSLSIVYFIGEVVVTLTSMRPLGAPNVVGPVIGLLIIAFGTGGIKPCVSAFGGSQFEPSQTRYINTFFSVFYMSINIGSTVGTILTPIFRSDVKCFGKDCYPLAFGVPAAFMSVAIVSFVLGTFFYKRRGRQGDGKNIIIETVKCIFRALKNKIFGPKTPVKKDNWLQYADTHHTQQVISDVRGFLRVVLVFVPLPIFWALYDQQGSRWTDQAIQLDGRIGSFVVKPDQMQAVNPILIIVLIPLFDFVVYPLFAKINLFKRLLQRMFVGLCLAGISFLISALLEYKMQQAVIALNPTNNIRALNLLPCSIDVYGENQQDKIFEIRQLASLNHQAVDFPTSLRESISKEGSVKLFLKYSCSNGPLLPNEDLVLTSESLPKTLVFYLDDNRAKNIFEFPYSNRESKVGFSEVRFYSLNKDGFGDIKPILSESGLNLDEFQVNSIENGKNSNASYKSIDYSFFDLKLITSNSNSSSQLPIETRLYLASCARYTILLFKNALNDEIDTVLLTDTYPSGIHLAWQLFQIFVMAVAEILFSISGIAFAFSQAPATMKSACQAAWYITVAIGNLIVIIVAESRFIANQVFEYIFFAGVMGVATVIFLVLIIFYKYVEPASDSRSTTSDVDKKNGDLNYDDDDVELVF